MIVCPLPTGRVVVAQVATPPLRVWASHPVMPVPVKATVPVGLEPPLTVAVKVTLWPTVEGLAEELTAVVVVTLFTVWLTVPKLVPLVVSPL